MKKHLTLCIILSLILSFVNQVNVLAGTIKIPNDIKVLAKVEVEETMNSETIQSGYEIPAVVASDVVVNNILIFRKHTPVRLIATEVTRKKFAGTGGEIRIKQAIIKDVRGKEHTLNANGIIKGTTKDWVPACMCLSTTIILLPFLAFGFIKGGSAVIPNGFIVECILEDTYTF